MINFKYVEVTNFLSFGNQPTRFDLSTNESVLVVGRNEDVGDNGNARNGSGKSSSVQSILFALYGRGIEPKLKADDFVNIKNGKKLEVKLVFEKAGKEYTIIRKRKPASLELLVDGEPASLDTMKNTDQVISSIIGMPYEIFIQTFVMSPHIDSFLAVSPSDQRSMIEAMLSLDILSERAESLKLIRKDLEVDIKVFERDLANANQVNSMTTENITRLQSKFEKFESELNASIEELEEFLSQPIDFEQLKKEFAEKSKNLLTIDELSASITKYTSEITELKNRINILNKDLSLLENTKLEIEKTEYKANTYIEEIEKELEQYKTAESLEEIEETIELLEKIQNSLKQLEALSESNTQTKRKLEKISKEIERETLNFEKSKRKLEAELQAKLEEIAHLEEGKCHVCGHDYVDEEAVSNLKKAIKQVKFELKELEAQYNEAVEELTEEHKKESMTLNGLVDEFVAIEATTNAELAEIDLTEEEVSDFLSDLRISYKKSVASKSKYETTLSKLNVNPYQERLVELLKTYPDIDSDVKKCASEIKSLYRDLNKLEDAVETLLSDLTGLHAISYPLLERHNCTTERDIARHVEEFSVAKGKLKELKQTVNPYEEEIAEAKKMLIDVSEIQQTVDSVKYDIENIGYLIKLLTSNNSFIRKNILDLYIPYLNKKIMDYTDKLGLMHLITINNDLSTNILYMGKDVSYYNLSQGERLRANLAVTMAFRDLVGSLGKNSNITVIDEVLDAGGDSSLVSRSMMLLQSKGGYRVIISHRSDISEYVDRTQTIVKRNGFSLVE